MGNRVVVGIKDSPLSPVIFIYAHWGTSPLQDVAKALTASQSRWNDFSYATRIAINTVIGIDHETTGGGVSTYERWLPESNHDLLPVIVWCNKTVDIYRYNEDAFVLKYLYTLPFNDVLSTEWAD